MTRPNVTRIVLTILTLLGAGLGLRGQISINSLTFNQVENFDGYAGSAATLPAGWTAAGGFLGFEGIGNGSESTQGFYAYGAGTDYSAGVLIVGNRASRYSVEFVNNSGATITDLTISWDYEQWRFDNTSGWNLSGTGALEGVTALEDEDFTGNNNGTNGAPEIDSRTVVLTGLTIPDGDTFGLSWTTTDAFGSDNGVSIDNFEITAETTSTPGCEITDIAIANPGACVDAPTDYFEAEVVVTFTNAPPSGDLLLSGADVLSTGTTTAAIGASPQTITGVRLRADGNDPEITAVFSTDGACTYTEVVSGSGVAPCPTGGSTLDEVFSDAANISGSSAFFSNGTDAFLGIYAPAGGSDFGGDPTPAGVRAYSGFSGSFLTAQDLNGQGGSASVTLSWTIDIKGLANLMFSGDFAAELDGAADAENRDEITLTYQIDDGPEEDLLAFRSDALIGSGVFREDTDSDGLGDGMALSALAFTFSKPITGTGDQLELKLTIELDDPNDDFGADDFAIVGTSALPIELIDFSGTRRGEEVLLTWRTATELNNDYMAVERSADGRQFAEIGRVAGQGTTFQPQSYSFVDTAPLRGVNYYRLRQVDFDGATQYHRVIAIAFDSEEQELLLSPVPAGDRLSVQLAQPFDAATPVIVTNTLGATVLTTWLAAGDRNLDLEVSALPGGMYYLRIGDRRPVVRPFVKR